MNAIKCFFLGLLASLCLLGNGAVSQSVKPVISVSDYILQYRSLANQKMKTYRIPASIILGQGILESANGNSELAINANNHFGVKCHKDWQGATYFKDDDEKGECFRKYPSVDESYEDHSRFLVSRERYAGLFRLDPLDYKAWAKGLKEAGYATNPDYARLLIKVIEDNRLWELDQGIVSNNSKQNVQPLPGKTKAIKDGFDPIVPGLPKRQLMENNGVPFVYALANDDFEKLSLELDLMPWQIRKYNDIGRDHHFTAGEVIYSKPKRRKAQIEFHTLSPGEDMWSVSQRYGMKLKLLYRKNKMEPGTQAKSGATLWLRKNRP